MSAEEIVVPEVVVTNALIERFKLVGERVELSGLNPLLIEDPDAVYLVERGRVELFTVAIEEREPSGHRAHFIGIGIGDLLFGMALQEALGAAFLAVGRLGTVAWRMPRKTVMSLANDPNLRDLLATGVDRWVEELSRSLTREIQPVPISHHNLTTGTIEVENRKRARAQTGVVWLECADSLLLYVGLENLSMSVTKLFPISVDTWVEVSNPRKKGATLTSMRGVSVIQEARYWNGLELFHDALCACEFLNKRLSTVDEINRIASKAANTQKATAEAYGEIYSVLAQPGRKTTEVKIDPSEHPFGAASRLVGAAAGIEIRVPKDIGKMKAIEDRLQAIGRAGRFRVRAVALRDDWWNHDQGPILAMQAEGSEAVALVPRNAHSYDYIVPATGQRGRVTEAFAATLSPFGATFYRPLPDGPISAFGLLTFGLRGLRGDVLTLVLVGVLMGALGSLTPLFTGQIFDSVIPEAERGMLIQLAIALLLTAVANLVFSNVQQIAALRLQGRMDYSIQAAVWDRLLNLPSGFFSKYSAGDLADRASGVNQIRQLLAGAGITAILGSITSAFYVVLLFVYSVKLALVAMGLTLLFVSVSFFANLAQLRYQRQILSVNGRIAGLLLSLLSGVSKLRTSGAEAHAFKTWAKQYSHARRLQYMAGSIQNAVQTFNGIFPVLSSMVMFFAMVKFTGGDTGASLTTGQFIAFTAAYGAFLGAMVALSDASLSLLRSVPIYERLRPIVETPAEVDGDKDSPGELTGAIDVSHVHFRYSPDSPWILTDVSLSIRAGEFVAFVGGSGSGKSTLMRLIVGFEKPEKGIVSFDGKDLATLDLREVRQQMGVVLQDSQLLPVDIFRNIVGTSSRTIEEAWEAARKVGLEKDIRLMPMGMHTYVMEGGGSFSGGQKQRLLLARSVVHNPRILILDEATSALDNKSQAQVTASTEKMQATRIVIAHRLSTIINADGVVVLDKGVIKEIGNFEQLMAMNGLFAELATRQIA